MPHRHIVQFDEGVAKVLQLRELQNCEAWKRALQNNCKDHRYYEIVEETLDFGFEHYYLVLETRSGEATAIQPLFFLRQTLVEVVAGTIRLLLDRHRKLFPRFLTMRV